ncbi:MAG: helix-turn-helix domain-containing protein [Treponema sp.]|nr:helix-turn-helix domain-containing protein [Treponema sp.]
MTLEEQEQFVYKRLRQEREKANLSQMELSLESGVSQNMITYIENGKRTPTVNTLLKLCNALNISPAVLFPSDDIDKQNAKETIIELIQRFM